MSHKLNFISTRIDEALHEKVKHHLEENGVSMSDFLRTAVEGAFSNPNTEASAEITSLKTANTEANTEAITALTEQLQVMQQQLQTKDSQLQRKEGQLESLQNEFFDARRGSEEAAKRSDMLMAQMTQQLIVRIFNSKTYGIVRHCGSDLWARKARLLSQIQTLCRNRTENRIKQAIVDGNPKMTSPVF